MEVELHPEDEVAPVFSSRFFSLKEAIKRGWLEPAGRYHIFKVRMPLRVKRTVAGAVLIADYTAFRVR